MYIRQHYAAGILPVAFHRDQVMFLVGKDVRDNSVSDFGGKAERMDRGIVENTAAREFSEETYNLIIPQRAVRQRLCSGNCLMLKSKTQSGFDYYMYVVEVPYIPHLRNTMNKVIAFMRSKNIHRSLVEKIDACWATLPMLTKMQKRSVFAATMAMHMPLLEEVSNCTPDEWHILCSRHAYQDDAGQVV
jgi:hypothetical protein